MFAEQISNIKVFSYNPDTGASIDIQSKDRIHIDVISYTE